jgi:hypothetical protein
VIARIHQEEGTDSSSGGSGQAGDTTKRSICCRERDAEWEIVPRHHDPRRQGPLYVEARGYLHPAVDFFARAVQSADIDGSTSGGLLAAVGAKSSIKLLKLTTN